MSKVGEFWTESSFECYKNNCECSEKCSNYHLCKQIAKDTKDGIPPIKKVVSKLLSETDYIPFIVTRGVSDMLSVDDVKVLKHILLDNLSLEEVAEKMNCKVKNLQDRISRMMTKYSYNYYSKRSMKRDFDNFKQYAKENIIPEVLEYEKVGVEC